MLFLLSNDDGIHAPGLEALALALAPLGTCYVVAPETEQSAASHKLSLHRPLRAQEVRDRWFAVAGSPADAVYMGLKHFCPRPPDAVICGINRGANVSFDIYYSGTVAAAREAAMSSVPALAVSLYVDWKVHPRAHHWATAGTVARRVVQDMHRHGLPPDVMLNLNVPDLPLGELKGMRLVQLGKRIWSAQVEERRDPKDRPYFWLGGNHVAFADIPESDGPTVNAGYATLTPLHLDTTARDCWGHFGAWPSLAGLPVAPEEP